MKIWRKTLKITSFTIVFIIIFMILMVFAAKIFENQLASYALERLETEIDAPMSIGKVSLIPLFSFPRFSAEINNLWIGDPKSTKGDTLFFINSLKVGLDTRDLMKGVYSIDKVEVSGLNFDYIVNSKGASNIDFLIYSFVDTTAVYEATPEIQDASLDLSAEKCRLENIQIYYYDSLTQVGSHVFIPEINIKAKTKNDIYSGSAAGSFLLSHLHFEDTKMDQMELCTVNFDVEFNDQDVMVDKLLVSSEGIGLAVNGNLRLGDTLTLDAALEAGSIDFDTLKKYLPDDFAYLFKDSKIGAIEHISLNIALDYASNGMRINNLLLKSEGMDVEMAGTLNLSDTMSVDAAIDVRTMDIDILKKFIPKQYYEAYGITDLGGIVAVDARIKGRYADSTLMPVVDADVRLNDIRLQTLAYPGIRNLNFTARLSNGDKADLSNAAINISNLEFNTSKSSVHLKGSILGVETPQYKISADMEISLSEFAPYIPDSLAKNPEGTIIISGETFGTLPQIIPDDFADYVLDKTSFNASFRDVSVLLTDSISVESFSSDFKYWPQDSCFKEIYISKLNLKSEALNLDLRGCSLGALLSGSFSDPYKMGCDLKSFRIYNGNNMLSGNARIENFEAPVFDVNAEIRLQLEDLMAFTPDSLVKNMRGKIDARIHSRGKIHPDSLEAQMYPILFENSSFNLSLHDLSLEFPDSLMNIEKLSAKIDLKNDLLSIDDASFIYNGLSIGMDSGLVQNIYKAVLLNQKEELYAKIHLKFGDINFDDFKIWMDVDSRSAAIDTIVPDEAGNSEEAQNWTFLIHGSASVNQFIMDSTFLEGYKINRLHLDDVSTLFKFTDSTYILDQFKFRAFEGEMNNSFHFRIKEDGTQSVSSHNIIRDMNIRALLRDMDNFGMDSIISYENISGLLSSDLNMFIPIDDSVLMDKMMISGDLTLAEGGVYNYEPAREMSKFTRIKELDNIQFKTLRSNIFMFKNKLYVPRTNIVSNALDIAAFGMQSLGEDYEYHLEIHLSNILFGKSKKRNNKQNASGEEIDEELLKKSSHKIRYAEIEGDSKVGLDTKASRDEMMNKIRVQQKMLDFIFFPKNIHYNTAVDKKL